MNSLLKTLVLLKQLIPLSIVLLAWGYFYPRVEAGLAEVPRILLFAISLGSFAAALQFGWHYWRVASKNPRWGLRLIEEGGFWQAAHGGTVYCGKCVGRGERQECKFDQPNLYECLRCGAQFSPHK